MGTRRTAARSCGRRESSTRPFAAEIQSGAIRSADHASSCCRSCAVNRQMPLEVESDLRRHCPGRYVMRPGEGRQEVVERDLVGDIDGCDLKAPLVFLAMEKVVIAHC